MRSTSASSCRPSAAPLSAPSINGTKLIVIGYRKHRVAEHADIFLSIKPDTEGFLYVAMAKVIIDRGIMDLDYLPRCSGYQEFIDNIQAFDLLLAARRCDVDPACIEQAALVYAQNTPGMMLYSAGAG